ncbi:MAG: hypothetical protein ACE5OY_03780 [Candidatus Bathyarchaeia archaeon]
MTKEELLNRAKRHIFSTGVNDITSRLCRTNMKFGLAKFHLVQEKYGFEPNATFISAPDETITRNRRRWNNGVGYGGKICWGNGRERFVILDVMPNACGMLVGGLDELPDPKDVINSVHEIRGKDIYIDDTKVEWDFQEGNHFIDVFKIIKTAEVELPEFAFVIHGSGPEFKGDSEKGLGLYVHQSKTLREMADRVETPFGVCNVVTDDNASEYMEFYFYVDQFSKKRRSLAAKEIFGEYDEIINLTHQGMVNYNEICLGCHDMDESSNGIFPILLRGDLPAYLVKGKPNFDDETIEILGFRKRAEELGVLKRLEEANILPHGGGYNFPDMLNVLDVVETPTKRYFIVEMVHGMGDKIVSEVDGLQFSYRGREVIVRALELGLAEIVARMLPQYVLKI